MTTTTNVKQVKLNVMTQAQYNSATKNPTELYMITDAPAVTVDSALSTKSENPVQNKVVTNALNGKVAQVSAANKIYGTDASGNQTSYDYDSFGKVDDVKVGTTSVVSNKIATLGTMAGEATTSYYTKSEIDGKLSGAMHFKGTKATVSDLPSSGQQVGDMYNVTETGANYAWDGSAWDKLSENIDLSGLQPNLTSANAGTGISITGSGSNVIISNTQTSAEWGNITGTLSNQTDLQNVLNGKQETLVSGTNIKTINNTSLLGSGNISITEPSIATTSTAGIVKPDGTSIVVADDGTISTQLSALSTKVVVDSYTATNNQTVFQLSKKCDNKDYLSVNVSNTELTSSSYELANDGMSVTLLNGVAEGALVDIRYFSNIYLGDEGATFTPSVSKTNYTTTLSWSNNRNLPNPSNVNIYDGVIWTPTQTKSGRTATISWNNNQGKTNPDSINLYDGVTFKPNITMDSDNQTATMSWSNDGGLPNPQNVTLYLGQDNTTQRFVDSFIATTGQTQFVATRDIESGDVLSVNIENTELLQSSFSLGTDHRTVTIVDPVQTGAKVELKYFHNLIMAQDGVTFTPHVSKTNYTTTLSWTNDSNMTNPNNVNIYDGVVWTPAVTATTGGYNLSWTNNQGKTNPSTVFINSIYAVGPWSSTISYNTGNLVTYEDSNYYYGYIAKQNIPSGTPLTDDAYWTLAYTTTKQYIAATIVDWGE